MPETTPLQPLAPWVALAATEDDWDATMTVNAQSPVLFDCHA